MFASSARYRTDTEAPSLGQQAAEMRGDLA